MEIDVLPSSILTVENLTNAEVLARDDDMDCLLIYTAGFPNRTVQALLAKVAATYFTTIVCHWGIWTMAKFASLSICAGISFQNSNHTAWMQRAFSHICCTRRI